MGNSCLQMLLPLFCQQAGDHQNNITGRAHLPSALPWQRGTRRNDRVPQILNMKDGTCLASEAALFTVPQWALRVLWSGNSIADGSVDEEGSEAMLWWLCLHFIMWTAAGVVMSGVSKCLCTELFQGLLLPVWVKTANSQNWSKGRQ